MVDFSQDWNPPTHCAGDMFSNPINIILSNGSPRQVAWRLSIRSHIWRPPTDLYETENSYVARVEIAGVIEADISIHFCNTSLTITGIRPDTAERRAFHQMEINYGQFRSDIEIPGPVAGDQIQAEYHNGFLTITLPKALPKPINLTQA